jgi:hypothetical protein
MRKRGASFLGLLLITSLLALVSGCGSGAHKSDPAPTTSSPSGTSSNSVNPSAWPPPQHPGAPNTCTFLSSQTAATLAGAEVGLVGPAPQDYWPNIICEYATPDTTAHGAAIISLVATILQIDGHPYTPAEWSQLVRTIIHRDAPVANIPALTSPGYFGWDYGPLLLERSTNETYTGTCGFAKDGYAYYLGGQWSAGLQPPTQATLVATCEKIASEA